MRLAAGRDRSVLRAIAQMERRGNMPILVLRAAPGSEKMVNRPLTRAAKPACSTQSQVAPAIAAYPQTWRKKAETKGGIAGSKSAELRTMRMSQSSGCRCEAR
jgi:hypothetical protein